MGRTVKELQQTMDAAEFMEHWVDHLIEPWGEGRADLRMGILAATVANTQRSPESEPFSAADFLPNFATREPDAAMDEDTGILELQNLFEWMTVSTGGEVREGEAA